MSHAFPKSRRIRQRRDFYRLYQHGRLLQDEFFRIYYCISKDPTTPGRLGLTVGKALGRAVQRNRIKRTLREVFRHRPELSAGLDLVVQPKPALAPLPSPRIHELFLRVLHDLHARITR